VKLASIAEAARRVGKMRDCEQLDRKFHENLIEASDNSSLIDR
jgi:DNA-binding GntR family transcriptional regulator